MQTVVLYRYCSVIVQLSQKHSNTSDPYEVLTDRHALQVGAFDDVEKAKASRNIRTGKGKMRNRRYVARKGPLIIFGSDDSAAKAFRNLPGVEVACVDRMNLLQVHTLDKP